MGSDSGEGVWLAVTRKPITNNMRVTLSKTLAFSTIVLLKVPSIRKRYP